MPPLPPYNSEQLSTLPPYSSVSIDMIVGGKCGIDTVYLHNGASLKNYDGSSLVVKAISIPVESIS